MKKIVYNVPIHCTKIPSVAAGETSHRKNMSMHLL